MVIVIKAGCHIWYCTPTSTRQPRTARSRSKVITWKVVHLSGRFPRPRIRREDYRAVECLQTVHSILKILLLYIAIYILLIHIISRKLRKIIINHYCYFVFKCPKFYWKRDCIQKKLFYCKKIFKKMITRYFCEITRNF